MAGPGFCRPRVIVFFSYIGFDAVSTAAQEAKNPTRSVPIGIMASLLICTVLYILMSGVMTGLIPYPQLNDAAPVAVALAAHPQLAWLRDWVLFGALAGLTSVILVMMLAQARIFLSMSHHGLLPPLFGKVHPRFRTPHVAHRRDRHRGRDRRRTAPRGSLGGAGVHRHADRLRRRMRWRIGVAANAP